MFHFFAHFVHEGWLAALAKGFVVDLRAGVAASLLALIQHPTKVVRQLNHTVVILWR
jgi:hypothetical protein